MQPGCSRGHSLHGHTSPSMLGRETSSEQPSGHREAAAKCVRGTPSCTRTLGEEIEESRQGPGLEQSCWARWHTAPCCSGHQQLPAQGEGTDKERSCFAARDKKEEEVHIVL